MKSAAGAALGRYPFLDPRTQLIAMPFAAMPEQVGVESILGMSDISEVQVDAVVLLCVKCIAIAYRALGHHRADFLLEPLRGFHGIKVESANGVTFLVVREVRAEQG